MSEEYEYVGKIRANKEVLQRVDDILAKLYELARHASLTLAEDQLGNSIRKQIYRMEELLPEYADREAEVRKECADEQTKPRYVLLRELFTKGEILVESASIMMSSEEWPGEFSHESVKLQSLARKFNWQEKR